MHRGLPPLEVMGLDLLRTSSAERVLALGVPFVSSGLYFAFALRGWWTAALVCAAVVAFSTYGSTSHDLVHNNLGLPRAINEAALALTELLALRSGHAYRISHLAHHRDFPDREDAEGSPAHWNLRRVLFVSPVYVAWLWVWSWRRAGRERASIAIETFAVVAYLAASVVLRHAAPALLVYAALMYAATWTFPVGLVYLQHDPNGKDEISRTRRYRGRLVPALLLQRLYHLEHHLYPAVPAHHWRELSRRLDPHLDRLGAAPIRIP